MLNAFAQLVPQSPPTRHPSPAMGACRQDRVIAATASLTDLLRSGCIVERGRSLLSLTKSFFVVIKILNLLALQKAPGIDLIYQSPTIALRRQRPQVRILSRAPVYTGPFRTHGLRFLPLTRLPLMVGDTRCSDS